MLLKQLKANTNGTRHQINILKKILFKYNFLIKYLQQGIKVNSGRCVLNGTISVKHKSNHLLKYIYRNISRYYFSYIAVVVGILYYSNTSAFVSLNFDLISKQFFYSIASHKVTTGCIICNNINLFEIRLGFRNLLKNIPTGALISSITFKSKTNAVFVRSAGTFGQLIQKDYLYSSIKLPSGKTMNFPNFESASIGRISNILHNKTVIGKAGRNRNMGCRPSVRGIAMNPVDHPHGGRTNGGRPSVTPWGLPTKGVTTVKKK